MIPGADKTVRLSVIDRLLGPTDGEVTGTWAISVEAHKFAVLRDLEWLLNTRRIAEPAPDHYPEVQRSVYHFGLPDVTARSADSEETHRLLSLDIEETIRLFEPRLTDVRVIMRGTDRGSRLARFTVEAMLRMDPNPERVVFDTVLESTTGRITVSGGADDA